MADPVIELEPTSVAVEPGGQARVVLTVVNEGSIVEGYRVDVLDDVTDGGPVAGPASWSEVLPLEGARADEPGAPDLTVYPGQQGSVVVVFSPPPGTRVPGGRCAFAVRVSSLVDPDARAVVEGDLDVGKVTALQAKIVPVTSKGRWRGNHVVELSNWGNTPTRLQVVAEDPDRALGFLVHPDTLDLPVGASTTVRVKVRTRSPQLRGTPARLPFTVRAEPAGRAASAAPVPVAPGIPAVPGLPAPDTATVDGAFTQKPILTKGVVFGAGLLLVGAVALTAYALSLRGDDPRTFQELGVPATPEVSVESAGPEAVRVSWAEIKDVEGYRLFQLDAQGIVTSEPIPKIAPELGAVEVQGLDPGQEYCFTMAAVRGEIQSPQSSPPQCASTEEAVAPTTDAPTDTGTPGETAGGDPSAEEPTDTGGEGGGETPTDAATEEPTGTGTVAPPPPPVPTTESPTEEPPFAPGEWAAVVGVFVTEGLAETQATELADALVAAGVEAVAVPTDDFPAIPVLRPGWLVLLGGFATSAEASQGCEEVRTELSDLDLFCDLPVQPVGP